MQEFYIGQWFDYEHPVTKEKGRCILVKYDASEGILYCCDVEKMKYYKCKRYEVGRHLHVDVNNTNDIDTVLALDIGRTGKYEQKRSYSRIEGSPHSKATPRMLGGYWRDYTKKKK